MVREKTTADYIGNSVNYGRKTGNGTARTFKGRNEVAEKKIRKSALGEKEESCSSRELVLYHAREEEKGVKAGQKDGGC